MVITKTPFRMSFFGGGTDIETHFKQYGGAVLSTTFDKYCYVTVRHLQPFFEYSTDLTYSRSERVKAVKDIEHPAIRNAMQMLDMHALRLIYDADLPARSGLGTSSSFVVGEAARLLIRWMRRISLRGSGTCCPAVDMRPGWWKEDFNRQKKFTWKTPAKKLTEICREVLEGM